MTEEKKPSILVMLASYNGEAFIEEQIRSILDQEGVDVSLWVNDDGSTDGTLAICERIAKGSPNVRVSQNVENLGVARNFMSMLDRADKEAYDFYAFSDQDDYWLSEKLRVAVDMLNGIEGPALYFSNIENTDINLENGWMCRNPNYEHYRDKGFGLIRTSAGGCVQVFNAALASLVVCDLPEYPRLHDSWVQLVAQFCGTVVCDMKRSFIKRRISGNNVEGIAKGDRRGLWKSRLSDFNANRCCCSKTAKQFLSVYGEKLAEDDRRLIEKLAVYRSSALSWGSLLFDGRFHMNRTRATLFFKLKVLLRVV